MKVVVGQHAGKNVTLDLKILLRTHLLIWASTGGGKSWLIRRLAEQFFGKVPIIIVDREGEFSTLREKCGFVLVGQGGETPADVRSAKMVAEKLLELRASAVCDLYELKHETRHEWVRTFVTGLVDAPKRLWGPTIIVMDEAHLFAPEKGQGESPAYGAVCDLAGQGRKRGFGIILATQRLAKLSKNATAELFNQASGATARQADRDRAAYEMGISEKKEKMEFSEALRRLTQGNFFFQGRAISMDRILVQVGPVETTHPEAGSTKFKSGPPPAPEQIKALLPKLADLPRAAEEEAKNLAEFKAEVRTLKAQVRAASKVAAHKEVVKELVSQHVQWRTVREIRSHFEKEVSKFKAVIKQQWKVFAAIARQAADAANMKLPEFVPPKLSTIKPIVLQSEVVSTFPRSHLDLVGGKHDEGVRRVDPNNNSKLRAGAERMLAALATWHPNGMTEGQMRAHAGLKKSGTFSAYMSDLRRGQYIEERDGMVFASDAGLDYSKHVPQAPQTTEEVMEVWEPKLRDGARRMLRVLVEAGGDPLTKEELGERANLQKSGTFSAYLSDLRTARLAVINHDKSVSANRETLFL